MNNKIRVSGLWIKQTKNGETYLSGNCGPIRIFIWQNNKKQDGSNAPDYYLEFGESDRQYEGKGAKDSDVPF